MVNANCAFEDNVVSREIVEDRIVQKRRLNTEAQRRFRARESERKRSLNSLVEEVVVVDKTLSSEAIDRRKGLHALRQKRYVAKKKLLLSQIMTHEDEPSLRDSKYMGNANVISNIKDFWSLKSLTRVVCAVCDVPYCPGMKY